MRRLTYLLALMALAMVASCGNNAAQKAEQELQDSTAFGKSLPTTTNTKVAAMPRGISAAVTKMVPATGMRLSA